MKSLRTYTLAAACIIAGTAFQANAGSITEVTANAVTDKQEATVDFTDLDLSSPQGQEALHYRLSRAAEQVCGPSDVRKAGSVAQAARNASCYKESLSRALSDVNTSAVATTN